MMCGILGEISSASVSDLSETNLTRLTHRGPDSDGSRQFNLPGGSCFLGHTRLRIIDLSPQADQPLSNESGDVWVVYNGEIYNYPELRSRLVGAGHEFESDSDTEVLVHLYEEHRGDIVSVLNQLRGMFAFALLDTRDGALYLGRDRLGIKPLYWTETDEGLAFASEVRALSEAATPKAPITEQALVEYMLWGVVRGPTTIIEGIQEVPPGHVLSHRGGETTSQCWWTPRYTPSRIDHDEAVDGLRSVLADSVRRHLVADRPVGVFLSGGVDSRAVTAMAAGLSDVRALTVTFSDAPGDEGKQARDFARDLGVEHSEVPVSGTELAERFEDVLKAMDQPTADGVNSWIVSRAARDAGLVVALSGLGGDELFGGYPSFSVVPRAARAQHRLRTIPRGVQDAAGRLLAPIFPGGRATRLLGGSGTFADAYRSVRGLFAPQELPHLQGFSTPADPDGALSAPDRVALLEMAHYLPNQLLRDTDQMSMSRSLEVRVPLLDDELVRYVMTVPAKLRVAPGKALLAAAAGVEPGTEKRGFTLPFDTWMRGPMRPLIAEGLLSDDLPFGSLIDRSWRSRLWERFQQGRVHWSRPWAVAVLRLWPAANGINVY